MKPISMKHGQVDLNLASKMKKEPNLAEQVSELRQEVRHGMADVAAELRVAQEFLMRVYEETLCDRDEELFDSLHRMDTETLSHVVVEATSILEMRRTKTTKMSESFQPGMFAVQEDEGSDDQIAEDTCDDDMDGDCADECDDQCEGAKEEELVTSADKEVRIREGHQRLWSAIVNFKPARNMKGL